MQGIYTYIPETNHVPKQYNVAAVLSLLFMVPISLASVLALVYFYISTFRSMCAVPNMAVFCIIIIIIIGKDNISFMRGITQIFLRQTMSLRIIIIIIIIIIINNCNCIVLGGSTDKTSKKTYT
jgi:hypothetical protein